MTPKWCVAVCRKLALLLTLPGLLLLYLFSTQSVRQHSGQQQFYTSVPHLLPQHISHTTYNFSLSDLDKRVDFSTESDTDVMVFLHMQKTGGTFFGKNLVRNLRLQTPCKCTKTGRMLKCPCQSSDNKRYWLFSRYSIGWKCGLHADYTELSQCLDSGRMDELEALHRERRYHYVSVLRDPAERFVSEWLHISRGSSWMSATLRCNGRSPTTQALPPCHQGEFWLNVTIADFMDCPHNLAINRQTRMLANLSAIGCYSADMMHDPTKRSLMLESAKQTLRTIPYYSIMSYLNESEALFERTFGLQFRVPLHSQKNRHDKFSAHALSHLPLEIKARILEVNDLDVQLYSYAKQLFLQRYQFAAGTRTRSKAEYASPYS